MPGYMDEMEAQIRKKAPICGRCHAMVMRAVEDYAREKGGVKIVASGDLLSSGLISIYQKNDLVTLNLPAFLAMDKGEAIGIIGGKIRPPLWLSPPVEEGREGGAFHKEVRHSARPQGAPREGFNPPRDGGEADTRYPLRLILISDPKGLNVSP